jgi:hypothetical protein
MVLVDSYCFRACRESSSGFQGIVHFALHSSLISLLLEPLSVSHLQGRVQMTKPMGKSDDHSRVAIWTECRRMDKLLTKVPHFRMLRDTELITAGLAERAQKVIGNMSSFVPSLFRTSHGVGIRCNKGSLQSGNHYFLGAPCFVAAGVLIAAVEM